MTKQELEKLARVIRIHADESFIISLGGSDFPRKDEFRRQMKYLSSEELRPGALVVETTTLHMPYRSDLDGVGWLIKVTQEPVKFSNPDFIWDEEVEGQSHPMERCVYIKTLDDREFRWTNASFVMLVDKSLWT